MTATDHHALVSTLKAQGHTTDQIARHLHQHHHLTLLAAMRIAHGLDCETVASLWTRRWPDQPITGRHLQYWEAHDTSDGYPPAPQCVHRLAALYQCTTDDLGLPTYDLPAA